MTEKILIIDDDLDTLRLVGLMLQKQGYEIAAANNGEQGLAKVAEESPDLILLDVMMPDMDGYEVAKRLRANPETAGIPILMFTAKSQLDDKGTGFEAGADDYLTKPTHPTELQAHVRALLSRSVKPEKKQAVLSDQRAYTIGVISARGGLGLSSIALNLGSFFSSEKGAETVVVELKPGAGTIGRNLGLRDLNSSTKLLKNAPEKITEEDVKKALLEHDSGLQLLPASEQPKDMKLSNAISQSKAIFSHLRSITNYLIADFGAGLPSLSQALLPQCDQIMVVIEGFSNSIAHSKILIENLLELGIEEKQIILVLNNRMRSDMLLSLNQVKETIDFPIAVTLTPAPELFFQAINLNTTAILHEPESMTNQQFKKMGEIISENKAKSEEKKE